MAVRHFLLVYHRPKGQLLELKEYGEDDLAAAVEERFRRERSRETDDLEIVVLSAESKAALERTHSRYFKTVEELAGSGG